MNKNIAIIGASGNVGRKVMAMLLDKNLVKPGNLGAFASPKSSGKVIKINNHEFIIQSIENIDFSKFYLCIFNTESDISAKYVPAALKAGAFVIDSSSEYRLNPEIPLIIPTVNKHEISVNNRLYAHANCLASPIATVVAPLHKHYKIEKLNVTTYQATSGAGKRALDECLNETKAAVKNEPFEREHFKRQIAFNVIPEVGGIREDGMSYEEYKIVNEVQKVVDNNIAISATAVRVPVLVGHCIALDIMFCDQVQLEDITKVLQNAISVKVHKDYMTPVQIVDTDDVHVGRIRYDGCTHKGIQMWLCSDNLRRGASTDCIEIAERILDLR